MAPAWNLRTGRVYFDYELVTNEGGVYFANPGEQTIRSTSVAPTTSANAGWTQVTLASGSNNVWSQLNVASGTISVQNNGTGLPTSADTLNFGEGITASNGTSTKLIEWDGVNLADGTGDDNARGAARGIVFTGAVTVNDVPTTGPNAGIATVAVADTNTTYDLTVDNALFNQVALESQGLTPDRVTIPVSIGTGMTFPTDSVYVGLYFAYTSSTDTARVPGLYRLDSIDVQDGTNNVWTLVARRDIPGQGGGDITAVVAGDGLTGGGDTGGVTLAVNPGSGISIVNDQVVVTNPFTDGDEAKLDGVDLRATRGVATVDSADNAATFTGVETITAGTGISFTQQTSAEANGPRGGTTTINSTFTRHTIDLGGSDTPESGTAATADTIHFFQTNGNTPVITTAGSGNAAEIQIGIPASTSGGENNDVVITGEEQNVNQGQVAIISPTEAYFRSGDDAGGRNVTTATDFTAAGWLRLSSGSGTGEQTDWETELEGLQAGDVVTITPVNSDNEDVRSLTVASVNSSTTFTNIVGTSPANNTTPFDENRAYNVTIVRGSTVVVNAVWEGIPSFDQTTTGRIARVADTQIRINQTSLSLASAFANVPASTPYLYVRYGTDISGAGFTDTRTDETNFIGYATTRFPTAPIMANDYTWVEDRQGSAGFTTPEIQVFRPTGSTNNNIVPGAITITLQLPQSYTAVTPPGTTFLDSGVNQSGTNSAGFARIFGQLDSWNAFVTNNNLTYPLTVTSSAVATERTTITGVNSDFLVVSGGNNIPVNSDIFVVRSTEAGVATYEVNLNNVANPMDIGPFALGTGADRSTAATTGVAALNIIRQDLIDSGRYGGFIFPPEALVLGDGTTASLIITTNLTGTDLGGGAVDFEVSNTEDEVDLVTGAEGGSLSVYSFTPPGGTLFMFNATADENLPSFLERLAAHITFNIPGWTARREVLELHMTSTTVANVVGLWAATVDHGTSPPVTRVAFPANAVETQASGQTVTGFDSTLRVNSDGQLGVSPTLNPAVIMSNTVPTGVRAGDIWINTSGDLISDGVGVFGPTFTPQPVNGQVRSLRQGRTNTGGGGTLFVGFDVSDFQAPASSIYQSPSTLTNAEYIVVSADGIPSRTAFSFGGTRRRIESPAGDPGAVVLFDVVSIGGVSNIAPSGANLMNPATIAGLLGIPLRDTYSSVFYQVSAAPRTLSQPTTYTPAQFRIYARGKHVRNATNTGWVSEVTGYEQLDG